MNTNKYTFWKLINQCTIEIPIIQRDYAQGRKSDKISDIRKKLLDDIYSTIKSENKSLDFDFIYGSIETSDESIVFIPLDGQQRLTTLFLLHWYLAIKDEEIELNKNILSKFTYETRTSSRQFCESLVNIGIKYADLLDEEKLSDLIKDAYWFYYSWKKDPTIKAMLIMLDDIHAKFRRSDKLFGRLISVEDPPITFQFLSLNDFGLTDNLYIKMNARGKTLTDFENFKAKFEKHLEIKNIESKKKFAINIDGKWTDIFWKYKEENVIDKPFMRYLYFITEMLYFFNNKWGTTTSPFEYEGKNPKQKFYFLEKVYSKNENVQFLFDSFDILIEIGDIPNFFNSLFSTFNYENKKVALFDEKINLFQRCIKSESFELREKILLFSILKYCVELKITIVDENLRDFVRVVRNLLQGVRTQIQTKYESNLRFEFLNRQLNDICSLINPSNIYEVLNQSNLNGFREAVDLEKEKIKYLDGNKLIIQELEDNMFLKGFIQNLNIESNKDVLPILNNSLIDIWSSFKIDSMIIRAMLTIDDYSIYITTCALGDTYLFGNNENWHTILTNTREEIKVKLKEILPKFLLIFNSINGKTTIEKLQLIINKWLENNNTKDWRYYFIKYPEMTSSDKNYYSWSKEGYEIRNLGSTSYNPLVAYHINPYIRTVINRINNKDICNINSSFGRYGEESPLLLTNQIKLYCIDEGWKIEVPENFKLSKNVIDKFSLETLKESHTLLLKENTNLDRIEIAIEFIKIPKYD